MIPGSWIARRSPKRHDRTHLTGEEADFDELAASKLTEAAKANTVFTIGHKAGDGGKL